MAESVVVVHNLGDTRIENEIKRRLETALKKGVAPLYAVHGAETLLALEASDRIRDAARKSGCTEREIFFAEPEGEESVDV